VSVTVVACLGWAVLISFVYCKDMTLLYFLRPFEVCCAFGILYYDHTNETLNQLTLSLQPFLMFFTLYRPNN
jgi:hypothetical protein